MNSICLLVAMYLVHTLFVKRQAEAKLAAANALRQHQREQYETARRHVALINHRCHELKVQLASLQQARNYTVGNTAFICTALQTVNCWLLSMRQISTRWPRVF